LLEAVNSRSTEEEWLICLVSDHGGRNKGHGGQSWAEMNIAFILSGTPVKIRGEIPFAPTENETFEKSPKIVDIVPVIAKFIGMPVDTQWDGRIPEGVQLSL